MDRLKICNLLKRSFHQGCKFIRISSAVSERATTLIKLRAVRCRAVTLFKCWHNIAFFLKKFFLRQLVFRTYSEKNLWSSRFIVELQSVQCRLATLLNKLHHSFSGKLPIFQNQSFCVLTSSVSRN